MLIQEESRHKQRGGHSINLMDKGVGKGLKVKVKKYKKKKASIKVPQDDHKEVKVDVCRFCKNEGHYQKNCLKQAWFKNKDTFCAFICFELNFVEFPNNTWWLDFYATTHVSTMLQGFNTIQTTILNKNFLFMGNHIEGIWTYRLILETGHHLS